MSYVIVSEISGCLQIHTVPEDVIQFSQAPSQATPFLGKSVCAFFFQQPGSIMTWAKRSNKKFGFQMNLTTVFLWQKNHANIIYAAHILLLVINTWLLRLKSQLSSSSPLTPTNFNSLSSPSSLTLQGQQAQALEGLGL